ncbi:MAG: hypothetical protein Terrestrivirus2_172 [Terrestrivirus sp.]|uniref:Uncharacterized protein n=1 Tax=Terrestrivirus sp. TaxID=2487775 RepID=A0A3G4ZMM2_9VIRU|nr:MAG: hypothetical protein Terrestrivirus2_172 [Terrestrivirus sp.]
MRWPSKAKKIKKKKTPQKYQPLNWQLYDFAKH